MALIDKEKALKTMNDYYLAESPTGWETPVQFNLKKLIADTIKECIVMIEKEPEVRAYD